MKSGKNPTIKQCKLMQAWNLDPAEWFVIKDTSTELHIVHRHSDKNTRIIPKY